MAHSLNEITAVLMSSSITETANKIQQLQRREEVAYEDRDEAQMKFEKLASLLRQKNKINREIKELLR